jgi:hypothetical protein
MPQTIEFFRWNNACILKIWLIPQCILKSGCPMRPSRLAKIHRVLILATALVGCRKPMDSQLYEDSGTAAALQACISCHAKSSDVSEMVKSVEGMREALAWANKSTLHSMFDLAKSTPEQRKAVEDLAASQRAQRLAALSMKAAQVCRPKDQTRLPTIDGESSLLADYLAKAVAAGAVYFYSDKTQMRPWQDATTDYKVANLLNEKRPVNPFMYDKMGYHSDGAREFPWQHSAGTDLAKNVVATKFMVASQKASSLGIRDRQSSPNYFGNSSNVNGPQVGWNFSEGTMFGEVLSMQDPGGKGQVPFEIRLRIKLPDGNWKMDVLRPFENFSELQSAIQAHCSDSGAEGCAGISGKSSELSGTNPSAQEVDRSQMINQARFGTKRDPLTISRTAYHAVKQQALVQTLPDYDPALVRAVLTKTRFKSVFARPWSQSASGNHGWAPMSNREFNFVPKDFFGAFIPMTQVGCTSCHSSAGRHVDQFDPDASVMYAPSPDGAPRPRTWYNFIPGNDGILSFHPFSEQAISSETPIVSPQSRTVTTSVIETCMIQDGILANSGALPDVKMIDDKIPAATRQNNSGIRATTVAGAPELPSSLPASPPSPGQYSNQISAGQPSPTRPTNGINAGVHSLGQCRCFARGSQCVVQGAQGQTLAIASTTEVCRTAQDCLSNLGAIDSVKSSCGL